MQQRHRLPDQAVGRPQRPRARGRRRRALLYQDLNLAQRVLRDIATEETIAHPRRLARDLRQDAGIRARVHAGARRAHQHHHAATGRCSTCTRVEDEIEKALARRVDLKSGGYLIVDQTEAMTTIDVNTGGFVGGRNFDDTIFKTNLEAAQVDRAAAAAAQSRRHHHPRLHRHGERRPSRRRCSPSSNRALEKDRTRLTVNGFTQLGLVEMTRKRTRESLAHVLCEPCPTCHGRGELKTRADRSATRSCARSCARRRQFNAREFRILASQPVIDLFLDEESQSLAQLGDFIGKPISLQVETHLHAGAVRHHPHVSAVSRV